MSTQREGKPRRSRRYAEGRVARDRILPRSEACGEATVLGWSPGQAVGVIAQGLAGREGRGEPHYAPFMGHLHPLPCCAGSTPRNRSGLEDTAGAPSFPTVLFLGGHGLAAAADGLGKRPSAATPCTNSKTQGGPSSVAEGEGGWWKGRRAAGSGAAGRTLTPPCAPSVTSRWRAPRHPPRLFPRVTRDP